MLKIKIAVVGFFALLLILATEDAFAVRCVNAVTIAPASQNLCVGGVATIITPSLTVAGTGAPGDITYTWYSNTVNLNSGGTIVQGPITQKTNAAVNTFLPPTTTPGTLYYYLVITNAVGNTCNPGGVVTSATVQVTVASASVPVGVDGFRCGAGTVLLGATPGAGETIDWYNVPTGGVALLAGSVTYTTPVIATTTVYYAAARNTTTGCVSTTRTAVPANVYAVPVAPAGTNGARCGAGSVQISATAGAGETIDWYDTATGGVLLLSGSTTYNTPAIATTTLYYAEARNPLCAAVSPIRTAVTAAVNPVPTLATVLQASAVCHNTNAVINLTGLLASTAQTISYNINGGGTQTANVTSDAGGNGNFLVAVTSINNGQPLTVTDITVNATTCTTSFNVAANLLVNDIPSITSQPGTGDQTVCKDTPAIPISVTTTPGSGTIATYQWYSNTVSSNTGGTLVATINTAATTDSYDPVTSTNGVLYYYVIITNSNGCTITSNVSGAVDVDSGSAPTITTQPSTAEQDICINGASAALTVAATGPSLSYQWYSSPNSDGSSPTLVPGATLPTYTPLTTLAGTLYYFCVISTNACSANSDVSGAVNVYPASVSGSISGNTPVCSGTNSTLLTLSGYTGDSFQWQSSPDNVSFSDIIGATSTTYTATDLVATAYYQVIVTSGVCTSATSPSVDITVNPFSVAGTVSGGATVCPGVNSTVLTLSGNTGSIQWQSAPDDVTFSDIPAETLSTLTVTNISTTTFYRAVVTSSPCAPANSTSVAINVVPANTVIWTGNTDGDWSNPSNWSCGIPDETVNVIIPSGLTNYPIIGPVFTEVNNFTMDNGASLTMNSGAVLFVHADFNNNNPSSSTLFINDFSEIVFTGAGAHAINGPSSFYYFTIDDFDGPLTVTINGEAILAGVLYLTPNVTLNTNNQLTVLSRGATTDLDGSIGPVPAGAVINGNVEVQRFMDPISGQQFRYLSSPVSGALPPALWGTNIKKYVYNASGVGSYAGHSTASPLVLGTGYVIGRNMSSPIVWSVNGPIVTGSYTWNFNEAGWHLLGNPFASAIRWYDAPGVAWDLTNVATTIGVTDNDITTGYPDYFQYWSYDPVNNPGDWGSGEMTNGVIAMGQAFWVYAGTGGGSLTIYEDAKESNLVGDFYRNQPGAAPDILKIGLDNGKAGDVAYLKINADATDNYEFRYDLKKLWNPEMNVYLRDQSDSELVINAIDKLDRGERIPVGIEVTQAGVYTLSFTFPENFTYGKTLYLIDTEEEIAMPVSEGKYTFRISEGDLSIKDRFYLSLDSHIAERTLADVVETYPNPVQDKLTIRIPNGRSLSVQLMDGQGKELTAAVIQGSVEIDMHDYPKGMYVLRLFTKEEVVVRKIIR